MTVGDAASVFKERELNMKTTIRVVCAVLIFMCVLSAAVFVYIKRNDIFSGKVDDISELEESISTEDIYTFVSAKSEVGFTRGLFVFDNSFNEQVLKITSGYDSITLQINPYDMYFGENNFYLESVKNNINTYKNKGFKLNFHITPPENVMPERFMSSCEHVFSLMPDGVIIDYSGLSLAEVEKYDSFNYSAAKIANEKNISFGIELDRELDVDYFKTRSWFDFVYISIDASGAGAVDDIEKQIKRYEAVGVYTVFSLKQSKYKPVGSYMFAELYDVLSKHENIKAVDYDSYALLRNPMSLKSLNLAYTGSLDFSVSSTVLSINTPENNITTDRQTITIGGTCDNNFPLYLNGNEITPSDKGLFAVPVTLKAGKNTFNFEHKGMTQAVSVTYHFIVLKDLYPVNAINVNGGNEIVFTVYALPGSNLTGNLGNKSVRFTPAASATGKEDDSGLSKGDYIKYSGVYIPPAAGDKKVNLGRLQVTGTKNGITQTLNGAQVTLLELWTPTPNGSERYVARMKIDQGDIFSGTIASEQSDLATPVYHFVPKGTQDYIVGQTSYFCSNKKEELIYYKLASGVRVYKNDCDAFYSDKSLVCDINDITADVNGNYTDITFKGAKGNVFTVDYNTTFKNYSEAANMFDFNCSFTTSTISFTLSNVSSAPNVNLSSPLFKGTTMLKVGENKYRFTISLGRMSQFLGHVGQINANGDLVIRLRNPKFANDTAKPLSGFNIYIDPGHGGRDPGAISPFSKDASDYEKELNLRVANALKVRLESYGAKITMSRYDSSILPDREQTQLHVLSNDYDCFISVHHNSSASPGAYGPEALYFNPYNEPFAKSAYQSLVNVFPSKTSTKQHMFQNVMVIRHHSTLNCLVECGYMNNINDFPFIRDPVNSQVMGNALGEGLLKYFGG